MDNLRALVEQAIHRNDFDLVRQQIDTILREARQGNLVRAVITGMRSKGDELVIDIQWRRMDACHVIPAHVIDAADPLHAAKVWGAKTRMDEAKRHMQERERQHRVAANTYMKLATEWLELVRKGDEHV